MDSLCKSFILTIIVEPMFRLVSDTLIFLQPVSNFLFAILELVKKYVIKTEWVKRVDFSPHYYGYKLISYCFATLKESAESGWLLNSHCTPIERSDSFNRKVTTFSNKMPAREL